MSDPLLVTEVLTDTITILTEGTLDELIVVLQPIDTIELETDVLVGQGAKGDTGDPPDVSHYLFANVAIVAGVLTINAASASTFWVNMDQNVANVVVNSWNSTRAQRIHVYAQQDGVGNREWGGSCWPSGTRWSYGLRPTGGAAGTIESFVLERLPVGNLVFGGIVGQLYS